MHTYWCHKTEALTLRPAFQIVLVHVFLVSHYHIYIFLAPVPPRFFSCILEVFAYFTHFAVFFSRSPRQLEEGDVFFVVRPTHKPRQAFHGTRSIVGRSKLRAISAQKRYFFDCFTLYLA